MSQQLVKKKLTEGYENVMPNSWIEAIKDKNTGQTLVEILQGFNMYFLPYNGNTPSTRCLVPTILRKKGLWITYVKYDGNVYTEWYAANEIDDESWGDSSNWRIGNNTLVGDITISANGNWVINGTETKFKAVGEKGNTPLLRVANNKLQVSYDLGDTYRDVTNNPVYTQFRTYNNKLQVSTDLGSTWKDASDEIAAYFRWQATSGDTQANNVGRLQISRDNKTWTNLSNDIINNLHISKYIGADESLPTSGIAEGTIYAKGPTYAVEDTSNSNPIYRLWVYAWKDNTLAWQDNGEFTSISAGVVQETGDSKTEVMSQKATTDKLTELESEIGVTSLELNQSFEVGTDINGYQTKIYRCPFRFIQGKKYRIENVSIAGKGLSADLYDKGGNVLQSIGTINPTPALTFVAQQDADFIGGYGTAWKVKISLVDTLEDKAEKGVEVHSFVIGAENEITYESEQGYYLNYVNGRKQSAGSNTLAVSKPIPVSKGKLVVAELSTMYDFVSAIAVTNADGTSHKMVVKGKGGGITRYYYIADKDGYVEVCYNYTLDNKVYISDSSLSQLLIESILSNSNSLQSINIGVDGDSITEGNQWSYYAAQILGANQYNVGVGSACWSYKDKYALDGKTIVSPQHYTDSDFVGFGGASNLDTDEKIQMWVNNNACTHIEKFVALVSDGTYPTPDVFVFAMGTNSDTENGNTNGTVDEAMAKESIEENIFVNSDGKSLKYTMCGAMRWCIETIKRNYPNCKVFVSLPIQRASYITNRDYLFPKVQLIKDMAIQMGCQIIDQYKGCGITSAIENDKSPYGPYLRDGLHPNTDGQKLMGSFAASQIKSKYLSL